jgi:hypothetical protein
MSQVRVSRKAGADNIARGEVPQFASLKLGLPTSTQFKDGLIRLCIFPFHPPIHLHSRLCFGLTGRPQADPRLPKSYFFVYLAALCLDLSFYQ